MTAVTNTIAPSQGVKSTESSILNRVTVFAYGVVSYGVGVAALIAWIFMMLGVLPITGGPLATTGAAAVGINLALMVGFGLQHSIMARPAFKRKWTTLIPFAAERSSFILATGLALGSVLLLWQPMDTIIWTVENSIASTAIMSLAVLGWAYLFLASFAINHFELFGLRQVYEHLRGREVTAVPFKERWMYRFDRHPIMTGALIGMWATPLMRVDHLLFASFATVYIMVGVSFEERALRRQWGDTYEKYKARVHSIVPTLWK
jgi:protein-S-isoprenylcysteine O-methyltransferase Ste14